MALAVIGVATSDAAHTRANYSQHEAWAAYHIASLPDEIRANVVRLEKACGANIAATHSFAVTAGTARTSFVSLHYERLWCPNRAVVCRPGGCLHEIYVLRNNRYHRVFSAYAEETLLRHSPDITKLDVTITTHSTMTLHWNGSRFTATRLQPNIIK